MIHATGLAKRFGDARVLDGVDLAVRAGERVALLGLNGAGKTTLIRCLLGLIPFEGRLSVAGLDVRSQGREVRARLGYVPQRAPHFDGTLEEVVDFFTRLRGADANAVAGRIATLGLDLREHGPKPVRTLSGGMLQKLLLALALGADVPLLLLDEPTANLDPRARLEFVRAIKQVAPETTVLLASHRLADVEAVADRLLVLHGGTIAFDGTLVDLWHRVGAAQTLWVQLPAHDRDAARRYLQDHRRLTAVGANGAALGVKVEHHARAEVLVELRAAGFTVEDFWTETPSLHDLLESAMRTADS